LELAYQESVRGLDMQSLALDELRSRTGVLIAAASVSSALLGAAALGQHTHPSGWTYAGIAVFLVVIGLCLYILVPTEWEFVYPPKALIETYVDGDASMSEMYDSMAKGNAETRKTNAKRLKPLYTAFTFASVALGADVFVWLIDLRMRR
jgi:hypothetical protein